MELPVQIDHVSLRTLDRGPLNCWLGPALRGLILKPIRDQFCRNMGSWQDRHIVTQLNQLNQLNDTPHSAASSLDAARLSGSHVSVKPMRPATHECRGTSRHPVIVTAPFRTTSHQPPPGHSPCARLVDGQYDFSRCTTGVHPVARLGWQTRCWR